MKLKIETQDYEDKIKILIKGMKDFKKYAKVIVKAQLKSMLKEYLETISDELIKMIKSDKYSNVRVIEVEFNDEPE